MKMFAYPEALKVPMWRGETVRQWPATESFTGAFQATQVQPQKASSFDSTMNN
jgi:hypothetical protein